LSSSSVFAAYFAHFSKLDRAHKAAPSCVFVALTAAAWRAGLAPPPRLRA